MPLYFEEYSSMLIPLLTISFSFNVIKLEINAIKYILLFPFDNHPQNVLPQTIKELPFKYLNTIH
jgi:hypothetical protein